MKKRWIAVLLVLVAAALIVWKVVIPNNRYNKAVELMNAGRYGEAITAFAELDGYKDSEKKIEDIVEAVMWKAEKLEADGRLPEAAMTYGMLADGSLECRERSFALWEKIAPRQTIGDSFGFTIALHTDGTVVTHVIDAFSCDVSDWSDIVAVSAGYDYVLGLRANGTVVGSGSSYYSPDWTNIVSVSAGRYLCAGLRADGTVVAASQNSPGAYDVSDWSDIIAVSAGSEHLVGLRADGTVVAEGENDYGRCDVSEWTDIVAVSAGTFHTVGLRADGTVVAVGSNEKCQCDVSDWSDIVAVSAGFDHTLGLRADGTVVVAGTDDLFGPYDVLEWTDIVAVSAGHWRSVGLRSNGTLVTTNSLDECTGSDWTNIKLPPKRS